MPTPEPQPSCWGTQTDYVYFVGLLGWLFAAGLGWLVAGRRGSGDERVRRAVQRHWATTGLISFALAMVCGGALGDGYGRALGQFGLAREIAIWAAVVAVLLTLAMVPPPGEFAWPSPWRRTAVALAGLSLVVSAVFPAGRPWLIIAVAGGCAAWLFGRGNRLDYGDVPAEHAFPWSRLAGATMLAVCLAWAAPRLLHASPRTPWGFDFGPWAVGTQATCLAGGAWVVVVALWRLYLQLGTLARIRAQRRIFRLRPVFLLPVLLAVVMACGFFLTERNTTMAEDYVGRRLVSELGATAWAADWMVMQQHGDTVAEPDFEAQGAVRAQLEHLLASAPDRLAAVLWRLDEGRPRLVAAANGRGPGVPFDALAMMPVDELELRRTERREAWVRWPPSILQGLPVLAVLPGGPLVAGKPEWFLSLEIDAADLDDLVATHRAQMLAIVALLAVLVGFAVVYLVRTLNEAELASLKERAEAENLAKTEFLAMVSHEVRTPLQSVLGYAELAQMEPLPAQAARHLRAIRSQGAILLRIVQDILDYSALRVGGLKLNPEPVSLAGLANDVQVAFSERARAKGVALSTEVDAAAPRSVVVDRVRLAQVLVNLVGNAVKFTSRGGVRLSVVCLGSENGTARMEFVVSDTGPGITPVQRRRLFEPFRKLRDDDTPGGGGVGLGLAISRQIVEQLGGRIEVDSMAGDGATFRVRLNVPVAEAAPEDDAEERAADAGNAVPSLNGLEILLIEDNPYVRELMREFLRRLGASVATRPDGRSGLEAARSTRCDVVLLDMRLPDMDGRALAATLREQVRSPQDPWVVGMSAGVSDLEIQRALEEGFNDFILKPVSMAGLAETIAMSPAGARIVHDPAHPVVGPAFGREPTREMRAAFFAEAEAVLARMVELCLAGSSRQVAAEAHYLANGCLVFGLEEAFDLCRQIERLAEGDDNATAAERARRLREVLLGGRHRAAGGVRW